MRGRQESEEFHPGPVNLRSFIRFQAAPGLALPSARPRWQLQGVVLLFAAYFADC
jgi:hypothetical protein